MRGWLLLLLLSEVLAAGCGSGRHVVRTVEAGSGVAREWRPGPGSRVAVKRLPFQHEEVIAWLESHKYATPEHFLAFLREIYSRPAMLKRFPNGF